MADTAPATAPIAAKRDTSLHAGSFRKPQPWDNTPMNNVTFEMQDLRVRIEDKIAHIDQRGLGGAPWRDLDQVRLPVSEQWLTSPIRTSPLKVALLAFERENPGNLTLRTALRT